MTYRPRVSPTQVSMLEMCRRKWGWAYRDKIRGPPNRYAQTGIDVHAILERYLTDATPPDRETLVGQIALSGIKHLPAPGTVEVEGRFFWPMPDEPFDIAGVIDWSDTVGLEAWKAAWVGGALIEAEALQVESALAGGVPRIGDHKTTGDFKWVMTPEALRQDVQAMTYAAYKLYQTQADHVVGRWVYYRTGRRRGSKCVDWDATLDQVSETFERVLAAGREIADWHAQGVRAIDMPYDPKGCDAYGGCPYRENCNLSSRERLVALMAQQTLKEKMAARKAGGAPAPVPVPAAVGAPQAPAQVAATIAAQAPVTAAPQAAPPAINPPEAAVAATMPQAPQPAMQQQLSLKEKMAIRNMGGGAVPVPSTQPVQVPAPAPQAVAAQPAPVVVQPVLTAAPVPQGQPAPIAAPVPQAPPVAAAPAPVATYMTPAQAAIDILYVDCAPLKSNGSKVLPLSSLLSACGANLAAYLDAKQLPPGHSVNMSLRTPEGAQAYETLAARAVHVVRGF